ncbi:MAG: Gfo/Idh/MocA family oxidoreductase [Acidobacteria bacterium]|nr:Gfo/Idh/MocA family oxidoreductase [Acidobacteriota bacterium]
MIERRRVITRREFVGGTLSAVGLAAAPAILRGRGLNDKLDIAIIGAGGRGAANLKGVASENIVALCDVNRTALDQAAAAFPAAKRYADLRKVFDDARGFDAAVVSTCEHTHAFATMLALEHGKHVYCEKPLAYNIWETRRVREKAATAKVATQMGIQIHAGDNYRRVVELVRSGAIGPVREVHVWVGRSWGLQSREAAERNKDVVFVAERPGPEPAPADLDWDLWLGPAPARPFNSVYVPGPKWYRWWDFGSGTMSDLGSHWNDLPFWALELDAPLTVEASTAMRHPDLAPATMSATYEYGARGDLPPVTLTFYQGEMKPQVWAEGRIPQWPSGCLFVGSKGMVLSDHSKHVLLPEHAFAGFVRPPQTIEKSPGHYAEWIDACKTGKPTSADFQYSGWLTEANHLGNVALRVGRKIEWDKGRMRATNAPEAERFIRREYRSGWRDILG